MYPGRLSVSLLFTALVVAVLPALGAGTAHAAPERRLEKKTAVLTRSLPGYPVSGTPANRQLQRANVYVHYDEDGDIILETDAWVKGDPSSNPDTAVRAHLGVVAGNSCELTGHYDDGVVPNGRKYWVWERDLPSPRNWDCAVVMTIDRASGATVDAMGGSLTNQYAQPRLTVAQPRLLDKAQKQVRLVRRVAQDHTFVVKNTGEYRARNVVVTARGKGMKTVRRNAGTLAPGAEASVKVPLRLMSRKKRATVRITASGSGVSTSRIVRVRAVKAPAKPRAGAWRSTDKTFTFKVRKGRITGFRGINMRMQCGGYGTFPTYRNVSLTFPTVKVPRHGYVDAIKKYRKGNVWYTATLRGRVVGKKMTQARYTYSTAGGCRVSEGFTARRR
ncbi:hypothetical protein [Aeromicrobium sp.]|uniref:hypothetical protein n=1 Tax=Aeromicrobium sp. TaxID=1871063 RepID=UPI0028A9DAA5|nr:hypothetical protein [Aeromicrobium sp.]